MRVTSKGQVTIPREIREKLGLLPETEIDFVLDGNSIKIVKRKNSDSKRAKKILQHLDQFEVTMSTEQLMKLTRNA